MPMYHYRCSNCNTEMEIQQRISEAALTYCPTCETDSLKRVIGLGGGFVLKGTGFYNTDYKNAGVPKSEAKSTDTKKETAPTAHACTSACAH